MPCANRPSSQRLRDTGLLLRALCLVAAIVATSLCGTFTTTGAASNGTPTGSGAGLPDLPPLPAGTARAAGPVRVVATTPMLADLVRQIGGPRVEVASILPPNADPHEFEPTPPDLVTVEDAALIVEHGLHLDFWAADLIKNAGAKAPVVVATKDVPTLDSDEEGFTEGDPHVWFDPTNVQMMVATIAAGLVAVDPDGVDTYTARRDAYRQQLDQLDTWIKSQIATIPADRRKLVTNHDAFGYFVARYGLTFVGSVIPSLDTGAEPSARDTAELIDKIKAEGVPAIFTEVSVNPELERELADQARITVVANLYGDTLGPPGSGADTYIGFMETDTRLIVEALR
jgi:ABC-type Zn uptake system ZnuABC Zn-binding protein ZnuA